jgi:hypothetical protein
MLNLKRADKQRQQIIPRLNSQPGDFSYKQAVGVSSSVTQENNSSLKAESAQKRGKNGLFFWF